MNLYTHLKNKDNTLQSIVKNDEDCVKGFHELKSTAQMLGLLRETFTKQNETKFI